MINHYSLEKVVAQSPHLDWLRTNTIFLTLHGSRAYGTNLENSDFDFRGIAIPPKKYFTSFCLNFEQATLNDPDTVVFNIVKFFQLASQCNPNCLEIIFTDPSSHIYISKLGEKLLENKRNFLSKRVRFTTSGYAFAQFKKIQRHRKWLLEPIKTEPNRKDFNLPDVPLISNQNYNALQAEVQKELEKYNFSFLDSYNESQKIEIKNCFNDFLESIKIFENEKWISAARKVGIHDNLIEIFQKEKAYRNAVEEHKKYLNWKKTRNPERAKLEEKFQYDCKHAYHLIRLLRTCKEVLTTGEYIVKRPDREYLLQIRDGLLTFDQLFEMVNKEEKEIQDIYEKCTTLPHHPNMNKLDSLCQEIIEESLTINN